MKAITRPANMKLQDWADQVSLDLDRFGPIGKIVNDDWQSWGVQLMSLVGLGGYTIASPYQFSDWKEWANRLCGDLS